MPAVIAAGCLLDLEARVADRLQPFARILLEAAAEHRRSRAARRGQCGPVGLAAQDRGQRSEMTSPSKARRPVSIS